jgi:hypothetical protein
MFISSLLPSDSVPRIKKSAPLLQMGLFPNPLPPRLQEGFTRIPENQKTGSNPLSFRLQHCLTYVKKEEEPGEIGENAPSLKEPVTGSVAD